MSVLDLTARTPTEHRKRVRPWAEVTRICLHQTATTLGETPERWFSVPIHVGVTKRGQVLHLHPLNALTWHANGLNASSVGIEIDGRFAGVEGELKTFWRPKGADYPPDVLGEDQINGARNAVAWIVETVRAAGGRITELVAHRQASNQRQSDPGSAIWASVGVWSRETLGLETPLAKTWGTGLGIPGVWDPLAEASY